MSTSFKTGKSTWSWYTPGTQSCPEGDYHPFMITETDSSP